MLSRPNWTRPFSLIASFTDSQPLSPLFDFLGLLIETCRSLISTFSYCYFVFKCFFGYFCFVSLSLFDFLCLQFGACYSPLVILTLTYHSLLTTLCLIYLFLNRVSSSPHSLHSLSLIIYFLFSIFSFFSFCSSSPRNQTLPSSTFFILCFKRGLIDYSFDFGAFEARKKP